MSKFGSFNLDDPVILVWFLTMRKRMLEAGIPEDEELGFFDFPPLPPKNFRVQNGELQTGNWNR